MNQVLILLTCVLVAGTQALWAGTPARAAAARPPLAARPPVVDSLAAATQPLVLKGLVLLRTGQPCAGASVYVAGAPRQLVITDAQGRFTLLAPAGATAVLHVDYFGEGTSRVKVALPANDPVRITLGQL